MFPPNTWVFVAQSADARINKQYGIRYYPKNPADVTVFFQERQLAGQCYDVTSTCTVYWGGDLASTSHSQSVQYVRLYLDYVPTTEAEMLNLAISYPGGNFKQITQCKLT